MKAVIVDSPGDSWRVGEAPLPEPGAGEALVRVLASGVCFTDVHQLREDRFGMSFPRIPGHEPLGVVESVGPDVDLVSPGDRVGTAWVQRWCGHCAYCARGRYEHCPATAMTGVTVDGGHAEYCLMDAGAVERVPEELDPFEAAPVFCAGYTVYSSLLDAELRPGERCAIVGVGGLGHLGVQYAAALGAEVFAVTRSQDKAGELRALGASEVVVTDRNRIGEALAARGGMDAIVNTANAIDPDLTRGLRPYGRLVMAGQSTDLLKISPSGMISSKHTVRGSSQGPRERLREALALHVRSGARTIVEVYPLDDALKAFERVVSGDVRFRAVLAP